jgi:carboxyl-terminal processing protease
VAYFLFRSFIEPARARLDELFVELNEAGVDELILDMRYNGGGRIAVAEQLAGQIGGSSLAG